MASPFALLQKNSSGSADVDALKIAALLEREGEAELRVMAARVIARKDMQKIISDFFPGTVIQCIIDKKVTHKKSGLHVWMVRIAEAGRSTQSILEILQGTNITPPSVDMGLDDGSPSNA